MLILYMLIGLVVALCTLTFTVLKLAGTTAWAWVWVLAPLWGVWGVMLIALIVTAIYLHIKCKQKEKPAEAGSWSGFQKRCDFFRSLTR